jgi:hypothetical protein
MLAGVTVKDRVPALVASSAAELAAEQARVAALAASAAARNRWDATLEPDRRRRLVRLGHFSQYSAELDWTPREVVGHLRDSATVFTDRLRRLCNEHEPLLPDFVTDAPERLTDYHSVHPVDLADRLRDAQAALLATVLTVRGDQLGRVGVHAVDGRLSAADVLAFLPGHQRDHADQLAALLS